MPKMAMADNENRKQWCVETHPRKGATKMYRRTLSFVIAIHLTIGLGVTGVSAVAEGGNLQLRGRTERGVAESGPTLPRDAIRVFVYEGTPHDVNVTEKQIAASYGNSGVLFDRATGEPVRRFTIADGWPSEKPDAFTADKGTWKKPNMVGPGVANVFHPWRSTSERDKNPLPDDIVARVEFAGRIWQARQPPQFLRTVKRPNFSQTGMRSITWSSILSRLNEASYLETVSAGDGKRRRFTTADGLAGNIVTDLVACEGSLWAACVDIFEPKTKKWGPGGLCRYDEKTKRWKHLKQIDGRPVRWVTLLREIDGELWVGFREGDSVVGDKVAFGMGLYPGGYRPKATAIVLARLKDGKWTSFKRSPRPETRGRRTPSDAPSPTPSEFPAKLARQGNKVLLFTRLNALQPSGNWNLTMKGEASLLDLDSGKWRDYDVVKDLDADQLHKMTCDKGETLITSNRGLHRFDWKNDSWKLLDPRCDLKNSVFHAAAVAGDELWVGYGRQSFGQIGQQGISRYSETTNKWSYMSPTNLKTASPVRRIVTLSNGEVWVLFSMRPWMGAAVRRTYHARERISRPRGLGRMANGKWEFPVKGPTKPGEPQRFFESGNELAIVGGKLLCVFDANLYVGPSPWRHLAGPGVLGFAPAKDRKTIEILRMPRTESDSGERKYHLGVYSPRSGKIAWKELAKRMDYEYMQRFQLGDSLQGYDTRAGTQWVSMPVAGDTHWVLGPMGDHHKNIIETPTVIWMFSQGQIIRVDRKTVDKLTKDVESGTAE